MPIWYQISNSEAEIRLKEIPESATIYDLKKAILSQNPIKFKNLSPGRIVLQVMDPNENDKLVTLNEKIFQDRCENDFDKLIKIYAISQTNLIKVAEEGMS